MTAKELATRLNISAAAISLAINGKPGVSEDTRGVILDAAEKYGLDISRQSSKPSAFETVHFIFYRRQGAVAGDTPFFAQLQEGIEIGCKAAGCKLRVSYIHRTDDVKSQLAEITNSGCSGIILLGTEMLSEDYSFFKHLSIPLVLLDVYFDTVNHDCILINNVQGAFLATSYLISRTGKQPGYLHSSYMISNFEERADGFYKAVRYHGMSTSKSIVHRLTPSVDGAFVDMAEILENNEDIAGCYFADNDWIAIGAIKALRQKGIKIPEDVSVIGFDNIPFASFVEPALTTVNVPKQYMGEMATRRLVEIIRNKGDSPVKIEIATNLVKRKSII